MTRDLIVIGGGTAGLGAVRAARAIGVKATLVTDGPIGGDCTFTGCVPSKTLIAESRRGASFADATARMDRVIEEIAATEDATQLRKEGIEVIEGRGTFTSPTSVAVDGQILEAKHLVIATGARASVPPIPGLDDVPYLTNESVFELSALPGRFGIIGAGAIGAEMAMAFAGFGSAVTIFDMAERVLSHEEPEASQVIRASMGQQGINVQTNAQITSIARSGDSIVVATVAGDFEVDALLVAAGRRPNTESLGLADVGVELDNRGHVVVDGKLATSVGTIRAAGDVTGLLPFTHSAYEQARMAVNHAFRKGARWSYTSESTPWVTFTNPEVARVGSTEADAASKGGRVAYFPLTHLDRAMTEDRTEGFVKLIAGPKMLTRNAFGGQLLGATIVAERAGEMIHGPTLALRLNMFVGRLAQVTTPYPTWSNAVQQAAGQFFEEVNGLAARPAKR